MEVLINVNYQCRLHGDVQNCIGCPCSQAIANVLKPAYVVSMDGFWVKNKLENQKFAIYNKEKTKGQTYAPNGAIALFTGNVPEEAVLWQKSHAFLTRINDKKNCAYFEDSNEEELLAMVPEEIRSKTLGDFNFIVEIPEEFISEDYLKVSARNEH